jgi:hypothetical protein
MYGTIQQYLTGQLDEIRAAGLFKAERVITTPQDAHIRVGGGQPVLNLCANNYLGLAEHPEVIAAAHEALDRWGYGLGFGSLHLRHSSGPQRARRKNQRVPGDRGHDPVQFVLRRQWRAVRDDPGRRGRRNLRRIEPRQHYRRRAALQSGPVSLPEQRYGGSGSAIAGIGRSEVSADRHGRRVFDGRDHRQSAGHL